MQGWRSDESGAIQAFEAVLSAVIILTALILFALTQRPALPEGDPGQDLQKVAADALAILQARSGTQALFSMVSSTLGGDATAAAGLASAVSAALPANAHWTLALDNGFGSLRLASTEASASADPVSGDGSRAYGVLTGWDGSEGANSDILPGGSYKIPTFAGTCTGLTSPAGPTGPGGQAWYQTLGSPTAGETVAVPAYLPFGNWVFTGCTAEFDVVLGPTTAAKPVYAVDLVVWILG